MAAKTTFKKGKRVHTPQMIIPISKFLPNFSALWMSSTGRVELENHRVITPYIASIVSPRMTTPVVSDAAAALWFRRYVGISYAHAHMCSGGSSEGYTNISDSQPASKMSPKMSPKCLQMSLNVSKYLQM